MHTYQRRWPEDFSDWPIPDMEGFQFRDAHDVARHAELEPVLVWRTWPEMWHLDAEGGFRCSSKGSSLDSVCRFAARPIPLPEPLARHRTSSSMVGPPTNVVDICVTPADYVRRHGNEQQTAPGCEGQATSEDEYASILTATRRAAIRIDVHAAR